jgi:hypothetical protein
MSDNTTLQVKGAARVPTQKLRTVYCWTKGNSQDTIRDELLSQVHRTMKDTMHFPASYMLQTKPHYTAMWRKKKEEQCRLGHNNT